MMQCYVVGFYPLALRDESVFENPNRFNPRRYLDNPRLKKHTFPFGIPSEFDPAHGRQQLQVIII